MTPQVAAAAPAHPVAAAFLLVRKMTPRDTTFVMDSWLRSAWHPEKRKLEAELKARRSPWSHRDREVRRVKRAFMEAIRPRVEELMKAGTVLVACDREDENNIAGWVAVLEGREVRSYIKLDYRGWGVDELLVQAMGMETP